jgi:hypothetical protein
MRTRLPPSFYNITTLAGSVIAGVSLGLVVFLMVLERFAATQNPYIGIMAFIILPTIMFGGLGIAAFGIWHEHRRVRLGKPVAQPMPVVDLNNPRHQAAVVLVSAGSLLLLVSSAFGSFKAYEHMESDAFCGKTCHTVMEPEFTAYSNSPHARVGCVKCHIGPGAGWFVRSKISGAYQMYSVAFHKYARPIKTPIHNLRPAQQTCEQCHWPRQFFSEKRVSTTYFLSDVKNTKWSLDLLVRIGGGNSEAGPTSGIHWHMNIKNKVTYLSSDSGRQSIPWVRSETSDGRSATYTSSEQPLADAEIKAGTPRRMDCIDCHNRPTHIYYPAARSVDHLLSIGWIDPSLPSAKNLGVYVLERSYANTAEANDSIKGVIERYYGANYPAIALAKQKEIARMVAELQGVHGRNYFPNMNATWKAYPDNIGHMYFLGCFRCHDGKHVSETGKVLTNDCNACHVILSQKNEVGVSRLALEGSKYLHPTDISDSWKDMTCSDCHNPRPGSKPLVSSVIK